MKPPRRVTRAHVLIILLSVSYPVAVGTVFLLSRNTANPPAAPVPVAHSEPLELPPIPPRRGDPIDPATAEAWKAVGFGIRTATVYSREDDGHFGVPHVRLVAAHAPDLTRLPEITVPFALELNGSEKADWLRQWPGLKNVVFVRGGMEDFVVGGATDDVIAVLAEFGLLHTLFEARASFVEFEDMYIHGTRPNTPDEVIYLRLNKTRVTGRSIKHLAGLKKLTALSLDDTATADAGLEDLATLPSLTHLSLGNTGVTDAGLKHVAGLPNLKSLVVGNSGVTGAGLAHVAELRNLTSLTVWGSGIRDEDLRPLAGLKQLECLYLGGKKYLYLGASPVYGQDHVTDAGLEHLASLASLRELGLRRTKVDGSGFAHLRGLRNLTHLSVQESEKLLGNGLRHLAELPNLTSLDLTANRKHGMNLKHLAGCKALTELHVVQVKLEITDAVIEGLAEAELLHLLKGARTADGQRPTHQDQVETLDINNSSITSKSAKHLAKLRNLKLLENADTPHFGPDGHAELQEKLPDCRITWKE